MKLRKAVFALCVSGLMATGCAHRRAAPPGAVDERSMLFQVQVQPGETLEKFGQEFAVPTPTLQRINRLGSKDELKAGQIIYIPISEKALQSSDLRGRSKMVRGRVGVPGSYEEEMSVPGRRAELYSQFRGLEFPLEDGLIKSHFGRRHGRPHQGIDIFPTSAKEIKAVRAGTVEFVGRKAGYGITVVINHKSFKTLYAHCSKTFVKKGEVVDKGKAIAHVGATGNAQGAHLHFEYRSIGGQPLDPMPHFADANAH